MEPKYPGAVEQYLNLGECYDRLALGELRAPLRACMRDYKSSYQRAYRCLAAVAEISGEIRATLQTDMLEEKSAKRAKGILSREARPIKDATAGQVKQRFLSAVTHQGQLCLFETATAQCSRIYELADSYGLAHILLSHLLSGLISRGYDVIACPNPMSPERLEHLLVPQLSLAFLSSTPAHAFPGKSYRRIRLDAMADQELLHRSKPRLNFYKKVSAALMDEAVEALAQAKTMHDEMECLYYPHIDFELANEMTQEVSLQIFE